MALQPDQRYSGAIHRAKWTGYDKADGSRGQALKYRVKVDGQGFADGTLHFSDAAAQKSYDRVQEVIGKNFTQEEFLAFMRDPAPLMVGVACSITTKANEYGEVEVQWLNPDGLAGKPMNDDDIQAVAKRLFSKKSDPFAPSDDDVPW